MSQPAFLTVCFSEEKAVDCIDGMTLRDYFAARAMESVCWSETNRRGDTEDRLSAERCYKIADAMLAARKGGAS